MGRKKKTLIITTNEDKEKYFQILNSLNSKTEAYQILGLSDNSYGKNELERISNIVGFKLDVYKERRKKHNGYCILCGKELTKQQKKFCSKSCAATFNNSKRDHKIYESLSKKLKQSKENDISLKKEKKNTVYQHTCENCGKNFNTKQILSKYCSITCANEFKHKILYKDFLEKNDKYCRGNYTPKHFKKDFLKEQCNKCAICGCEPIHNNKELVFILDHIDGDASNNKRENLRLICPNCDSQLSTYKSKNKRSTRRYYWKNKILKDIYNK